MNKFYQMFCVLFLSFIFLSGFAQEKEIIQVEPDYKVGQTTAGTVGNLNAAIAEVAANQGCGNVIFELERDAFYFSINEIRPEQQNLHVRAVEGEGQRPIIMAAANPDDGDFNQIFYEFTGNLTIEGLHITGLTTEGSQLDQALRTDAEDIRVIVKDCLIERYRDRALRMNKTGNKAYFYNTTIRNMGEQTGGGVGIRVNKYCDTLVVQNCVFHNMNNYAFQNVRNGLNYFEVTNCTFVNTALSTHQGIDMGRAKEVLIADNVFYNAAFRRNNTNHDPFFRSSVMDKDGFDFTDADRDIKILNNNWYVEQDVADLYDEYRNAEGDTLTKEIEIIDGTDTSYQDIPWKYVVGDVWIMDETLDTLWDWTPNLALLMDSGVVTFENNFKEQLTFNNLPAYPENYVAALISKDWDTDQFEEMEWFIEDGGNTMLNPDLYWVAEDVENPFDFEYNSGTKSSTAARDGGAIGVRKDLTTSIKDIAVKDNALSIYPNPASSVINIGTENIEIRIVDVSGRIVHHTTNNNESRIDISSFNPGLYIISVIDRDNKQKVGRFIKK